MRQRLVYRLAHHPLQEALPCSDPRLKIWDVADHEAPADWLEDQIAELCIYTFSAVLLLGMISFSSRVTVLYGSGQVVQFRVEPGR